MGEELSSLAYSFEQELKRGEKDNFWQSLHKTLSYRAGASFERQYRRCDETNQNWQYRSESGRGVKKSGSEEGDEKEKEEKANAKIWHLMSCT